jgi:streptogramin lyase
VAVWDPGRKVVWIGTGNSDVIYQFDPKTKQFLEFPLPRRGAYLRRIVVVPTTGDIWTSYASFPAEKGPADAVVLTPGEPGQ